MLEILNTYMSCLLFLTHRNENSGIYTYKRQKFPASERPDKLQIPKDLIEAICSIVAARLAY